MFPDLSTEALLERASQRYTPNYRQAPMVLVHGEGPWVWDREGNRYLDFIAGIAVSSLGHGHPRLVAAIREQAGKLVHTSGLFHNEPAIALMDKLVEVGFVDRVFFANSGAEANEAALKIARRYWSVIKGRPDKHRFLTCTHSFHGRTFATLTTTGQPKYHQGFEPLLPGVDYVPFNDLEAVHAHLEAQQGAICAVFVEPIQCEGGLNVPSPDYLKGLRQLCDDYEALLVLDEVQTGIGRTGAWFCHQLYGVEPDVMSLAKGLGGGVPIGAMCCTEEVSQAFHPGSHASTFGGNPLATRAGLEVMRTIEEEGLLEHVETVGAQLASGLEALIGRYPDLCVEHRGHGVLRGLELVSHKEGLLNGVVAHCRQRGLLINGIAGKVVRMTPPLTVTSDHVAFALEVMDEALGNA